MSPPYLALDLNPFRDVWHRQGHLCPSLLKSWEGHVSPPSADPRWHVINSEMSDIGWVTCAPPPPFSQTMGRGTCSPPRSPFNPFRDVSQAEPPVPPSQKLGGARVLSFRRSSLVEMPDNSRFAHFTPLINWLINASREGSRRPGALGCVKGAPGRVYRLKGI